MDVVHGELLPADKSKIIQEFKKEGPTCMVGDGVNDAPALANADIGISMGISGSALATQTGHIILMSNDIRRIPQAVKLARRARRKVLQNVFISITLKVAILVLAFAGHPLIWAAVLVDVGTCLIVILNSMLLLREKDKSKNKKCYRKKLEGVDEEGLDLEAGLLSKSQCNSGCCGDKKSQEKAMLMRPASKTSSDHLHSGCCGEKKQESVKLVKDSCCGEKSRKPEGDMASLSSCKKSNNDMKMKGGSSCCASKKEKLKEVVVAKSCCEEKEKAEGNVEMQILDLEKGSQKKVGETCKSSCCGDKEKAKETRVLLASEDPSYLEKEERQTTEANIVTVKQSCHEKASLDIETGVTCDLKLVCCGNIEVGEQSDPEKVMRLKGDGQCKSDCCGDEKKTGEITLASEEDSVDCTSGCKEEFTQICHEKTCMDVETGVSCDLKLVCCGSTEGEVREQSGCCGDKKKAGEITRASEEETDSSDCSSRCCGNKEELTQICHEKTCLDIVSCDKLVCCGETEVEVREQCDLKKGLQIKNGGQCESVCCGDEKKTEEITLVSDEETDNLKTESGGDCKSLCCGTGLKQKGSSSLVNVVVESGESGSSCCSKEGEIVKVSSQSCCTSPSDVVLSDLQAKKLEICCKVKKTLEEVRGSKCKETEKRHHVGKSCCRSYAKEYCGHRHHHHHHHHHHQHVGAA